MKKNHYDIGIGNLKALMLMCIVVNHSFASVKYVCSPQIIPVHLMEMFAGCLTFCLGAFFMISGYYTKMDEISVTCYMALLQKKVKTLLVPYFLWNAIYIVLFIGGSFLWASMKTRCQELQLFSAYGIADGLLGITHNPSDGPLWYIRSLFCCIMLCPVLQYFCRLKFGLLAIITLTAVLGWLYPHLPSEVAMHLKPYILPSFCLGIYFRERKISLHVFEHYTTLWVALGVLIIISLIFDIRGTRWIFERRLIFLPAIPFWMMLSKFVQFSSATLVSKIFVRPAFFIYASHALFGTAALRILAPHLQESPYKSLILSLVFLLLGGSGILLSYIIIHNFTPRMYNLLTGSRANN